ncbi:hypothetical protein TNCT_15491 [Trichonephila clavata]|uniref:Uncharacterized protein n=1 Tax=Trichonephila clavata TaxID=2740835 RepID=A0A8X6K812_TRICU|nr:hypothetical protein TNCT_15491 [Trichonephila clavata]
MTTTTPAHHPQPNPRTHKPKQNEPSTFTTDSTQTDINHPNRTTKFIQTLPHCLITHLHTDEPHIWKPIRPQGLELTQNVKTLN